MCLNPECHYSLRAVLAAGIGGSGGRPHGKVVVVGTKRETGNVALLPVVRGHAISSWLVVCLCLLISLKGNNCILLIIAVWNA